MMNRLVKVIAYIFIGMVALLILLLLSLPLIAPPLLSRLASDQNIDLSIDKLSIDWFDTAVKLQGIRASASGSDATPFVLEEFELRVAGGKLLRHKVLHLEILGVEGIELPIEASLNEANELQMLSVAGIDLTSLVLPSQKPDPAQEPEPENSDDFAMSFSGWNEIGLRDIVILTELHKEGKLQVLPLTIKKADIGAFNLSQTSAATDIDLAVSLNEAFIAIQGSASPLAELPKATVKLVIDDVEFARWLQLTDFLGIKVEPLASADGKLALASSIDWQQQGENHVVNLADTKTTVSNLALALQSSDPESKVKESLSVAGGIELDAGSIQFQSRDAQYRIERLSINSNLIELRDINLDPPLKVDLKDILLDLDVIDSLDKASASKISLNSTVGSYGKIFVNANGNFLSKSVDGDIDAKAEQINLPRLSGLAKNAIGKHIDKGALDFHYKATIDKNLLDSSATIEAHQLGLSGNYANRSNLVEELGMPLNAALNLLRDKDDTVRLSVPVNGDLNDPQIRIGKVVNKALMNGLKTAVISQFGPLLALSALDKAKDMAAGLKLKPVVFAANESSIENVDKAGLERLDAIVQLLDKRPKIKLNVCGVSLITELSESTLDVPAPDKPVINTPPESQQQKQQLVTLEQLKPEQKNALYDLANQRAEAVKDYFIDKSLEGNRIILCSPTVDSGEQALPAVKFSL